MVRKRNDVETAETDATNGVNANDGNANGDDEPKTVESKADKFRRLGNRRLGKAVKALNAIANLANRSQYEYTDEQVEIVVGVIASAVRTALEAFTPKPKASQSDIVYV
jgi:hypothetical protein